MAKREDGGPAFPDVALENAGMSLRDYFAAQALTGICGDGIPGRHHEPSKTAHDAYAYADAMLTERAK